MLNTSDAIFMQLIQQYVVTDSVKTFLKVEKTCTTT